MSGVSSDEADVFEIIHSTRSNSRLKPLGRLSRSATRSRRHRLRGPLGRARSGFEVVQNLSGHQPPGTWAHPLNGSGSQERSMLEPGQIFKVVLALLGPQVVARMFLGAD